LERVFNQSEITMLSTPGLTKDFNEYVLWSVAGFSFGYYRIYVDGAMNQPLFVFVGGAAKLGAACILLSWYLQGLGGNWDQK
jgi:hypothetical protein